MLNATRDGSASELAPDPEQLPDKTPAEPEDAVSGASKETAPDDLSPAQSPNEPAPDFS